MSTDDLSTNIYKKKKDRIHIFRYKCTRSPDQVTKFPVIKKKFDDQGEVTLFKGR